jgi:hypothetical protein
MQNIVLNTRISLYRHNSCVIKLSSSFHHHSTAQSALKGNVITFMQNMPNIVTSLPLNVDDLCDTLKIIFVGAHLPNRGQLRKVCGVSRQKVRDALLWLKDHNYLYRMIPSKQLNNAFSTTNLACIQSMMSISISSLKMMFPNVSGVLWILQKMLLMPRQSELVSHLIHWQMLPNGANKMKQTVCR